MKAGDRVTVYPHGSPDKAAEATVLIISSNGRSIAVAFEDNPPFAIIRGQMAAIIHPEHGLIMLATREELNGRPWGPWVEMAGRGHYEIEELQ